MQVSLVQLVQLVSLGHWAQQDLLATQDTPATLALQEVLEQLDLKVRKVFVEILGRQEHGELLEQLVPLVH